mgnify:CR=1 FL=1
MIWIGNDIQTKSFCHDKVQDLFHHIFLFCIRLSVYLSWRGNHHKGHFSCHKQNSRCRRKIPFLIEAISRDTLYFFTLFFYAPEKQGLRPTAENRLCPHRHSEPCKLQPEKTLGTPVAEPHGEYSEVRDD